jgi:hypothetical protein
MLGKPIVTVLEASGALNAPTDTPSMVRHFCGIVFSVAVEEVQS